MDVRERLRARGLMARNSTERLVVIWSRESRLFLAHRQQRDTNFTSIYECGIMLF